MSETPVARPPAQTNSTPTASPTNPTAAAPTPTTSSTPQSSGNVSAGEAALAVEATQVPDPNDVMNLSPQQRVEYILDVRRRIQADSTSVSDDEIRNAVRLIRISRSDAGRSKKAGKKVVPVVNLSDF